MDKTETYIKQCEQAHKIIYPDGSRVFLHDLQTLYWDVDTKKIWSGFEMMHKRYLTGSISTLDFREYFPIYRQDQLQKIDGRHWREFDVACEYEWSQLTNQEKDTVTKEQCDLRVIMRKFNKVWDGENWICKNSKTE